MSLCTSWGTSPKVPGTSVRISRGFCSGPALDWISKLSVVVRSFTAANPSSEGGRFSLILSCLYPNPSLSALDPLTLLL